MIRDVILTVRAKFDGEVYQVVEGIIAPGYIRRDSPAVLDVTFSRPDSHTMADLDRCVHGRHSIDDCLMCPGGWSWGNPYAGAKSGRVGTNYAGNPLYVEDVADYNPAAVVARRPPRGSAPS
jgi:hypothetical protein